MHSKHLGENDGCRGRSITTRTVPSGLRTPEICAESSPTRIPDRLMLITVPANSTLSVEARQTRQLSPKLKRRSCRRSSEAFLGTKTSWDRPLLVSAFVMTVPFCPCGLPIVACTRWSKGSRHYSEAETAESVRDERNPTKFKMQHLHLKCEICRPGREPGRGGSTRCQAISLE